MAPRPVVPRLPAAEGLWARFGFHVPAGMVVPRSCLGFVLLQQGFRSSRIDSPAEKYLVS